MSRHSNIQSVRNAAGCLTSLKRATDSDRPSIALKQKRPSYELLLGQFMSITYRITCRHRQYQDDKGLTSMPCYPMPSFSTIPNVSSANGSVSTSCLYRPGIARAAKGDGECDFLANSWLTTYLVGHDSPCSRRRARAPKSWELSLLFESFGSFQFDPAGLLIRNNNGYTTEL